MVLWLVISLCREQEQKFLCSFEDNSDYVSDVQWSPTNPALFSSVDIMGRLDLWHLNHETEVSHPVLFIRFPAQFELSQPLTHTLLKKKEKKVLLFHPWSTVKNFTRVTPLHPSPWTFLGVCLWEDILEPPCCVGWNSIANKQEKKKEGV